MRRAWLALRSAAGDGRQDRHLVAVGELGVEAVLEADVLAGDVDVDEAAQAAVLGDPLAQIVVLVEDGVERLADGDPVDLDSPSPPVAARSCAGIFTVTAIGREPLAG